MNWEQYYNSSINDFHRFVNQRCSNEMTVTDIDGFFVKVSKREIRFIESKHTGEGSKKGQQDGLTILCGLQHPDFKIGVFLVRGEYPYHAVTVVDLKTHEEYLLDQKDLISWLNFESELEHKYTRLEDSF